jgi:hypothetical protein
MIMGAWVVTEVTAMYIMLRVDPGTVLGVCSGGNCSPVNQWGVWLPFVAGFLGAVAVGVLLILRRRGILGRVPVPTKSL